MVSKVNFQEQKCPCVMGAEGKGVPAQELMTLDEVIDFLRIPEISKSKDHHNVVRNLIRFRDLPRIQICKKLLFPKEAILDWVKNETIRK